MLKGHISPLVWVITLLPYEIGLGFVLFGETTLWQAMLGGSLFYVLVALVALPFRYPAITIAALIWGLIN